MDPFNIRVYMRFQGEEVDRTIPLGHPWFSYAYFLENTVGINRISFQINETSDQVELRRIQPQKNEGGTDRFYAYAFVFKNIMRHCPWLGGQRYIGEMYVGVDDEKPCVRIDKDKVEITG